MKIFFILCGLSISLLLPSFATTLQTISNDADERSIMERRASKARENQEERWRAQEKINKSKQEQQQRIDPQIDKSSESDSKEGAID